MDPPELVEVVVERAKKSAETKEEKNDTLDWFLKNYPAKDFDKQQYWKDERFWMDVGHSSMDMASDLHIALENKLTKLNALKTRLISQTNEFRNITSVYDYEMVWKKNVDVFVLAADCRRGHFLRGEIDNTCKEIKFFLFGNVLPDGLNPF
ncbi:MAG TPA: hypothetical protein VFP45_03430 [Candidatus Nitrosotalea sp.]|nr:hypothetical protein [Candidatus Nitrosotalea sp.]